MDFDRCIIVAVLAGEASETERGDLETWRSAAAENDAAFLRQARVWDLLGSLTASEHTRDNPGERMSTSVG